MHFIIYNRSKIIIVSILPPYFTRMLAQHDSVKSERGMDAHGLRRACFGPRESKCAVGGGPDPMQKAHLT